VSDRTAGLATGVATFRSLGEVGVRGRAEHVEVFAVEGPTTLSASAAQASAASPMAEG
jgi:hypothetical protein